MTASRVVVPEPAESAEKLARRLENAVERSVDDLEEEERTAFERRAPADAEATPPRGPSQRARTPADGATSAGEKGGRDP